MIGMSHAEGLKNAFPKLVMKSYFWISGGVKCSVSETVKFFLKNYSSKMGDAHEQRHDIRRVMLPSIKTSSAFALNVFLPQTSLS
jgi:hypothetical protein